MSAPVIPVAPGNPPPLHARRCARHVEREAAARCPGCREFFCQECTVEHEGRLLCAGCLSRAARAEQRAQHRLAVIRRGATATAGAFVLWLVFYWLGAGLGQIPPEVHDGTVWQKALD